MYAQVWQTAQTAPKELAGRLEVLGRGLEAWLRKDMGPQVEAGLRVELQVQAGLQVELQVQVGLQVEAGLQVQLQVETGLQVEVGLRAGLQVQVQAGVRVRSLV